MGTDRAVRAEARGMNKAEHAAAAAVAAAFGHDKESLASDPDVLARFLRAGKNAVAALVELGETVPAELKAPHKTEPGQGLPPVLGAWLCRDTDACGRRIRGIQDGPTDE